MTKQNLNGDEQFYKISLSFFRAIKAKAIDTDTGELIEVSLNSGHKIIYMYFVHTQQFCEKEGKPFDYSIDHMADFCGIDRQKFMKRKKDLEKLGLIKVHRQGTGRKNAYTVASLDKIELVWPDGKLPPSRQRDYEKQRSVSGKVNRPSKIDVPSQGDSGRHHKEEDAREQRQASEKRSAEIIAVDFTKPENASQKTEKGNNNIEGKEEFGSCTSRARNTSEVPEEWFEWNETISIEAMSLEKLPITNQGEITPNGIRILKKYRIDPSTYLASWFCRELLDAAQIGGKSFTQVHSAIQQAA